jgi:hypothetical protein
MMAPRVGRAPRLAELEIESIGRPVALSSLARLLLRLNHHPRLHLLTDEQPRNPVSAFEQVTGSDVSIDAQRRALHELATARGLVVVDEFADAVESGKDDDRPGWQRLISRAEGAARAPGSTCWCSTPHASRGQAPIDQP